jgi:hypothetical protein
VKIGANHLTAVSDARRRVYRQEVQALAQVRQVKPASRPRRPVAGPACPIRTAAGLDAPPIVLLGARWYCPTIGRFLSPDPVVGHAADPAACISPEQTSVYCGSS